MTTGGGPPVRRMSNRPTTGTLFASCFLGGLTLVACRDPDGKQGGDSQDVAGQGAPLEGGGGAEFLQFEEQYEYGGRGEDWRPSESILVDCAWLPQVPPGRWPTRDQPTPSTANCGPTSLAMAVRCIQGGSPSEQDTVDIIEWLDVNVPEYQGVGIDNNGSWTNTVMLKEASSEMFSIAADQFWAFSLQEAYAELVAGRPVVVATYTQGSNDDPSDVMGPGDKHFMLLVGMTSTHVLLHDPGRSAASNGANRDFTIESFQMYWQGYAGVKFSGSGAECPDADGDGHLSSRCGGDDCNDTSPASYFDAPEICDDIDNDCNGVADDNFDLCWRTLYRWVDDATEARCLGTSDSEPPRGCEGYTYDRMAWITATGEMAGAFPIVQCSKLTDHIVVDATDDAVLDELQSEGYSCDVDLGHALSSVEAAKTPYASSCDIWRVAYDAGDLGAHIYTTGPDDVDGLDAATCEGVFAVGLTDGECFTEVPDICVE